MTGINAAKSILIIIGGTGFIGSALVKRLQDSEIPHLIVTRQLTKNRLIDSRFTTLIKGDITDSQNPWVEDVSKSLRRWPMKPQIQIIHCGGLVDPRSKAADYNLQNPVAVKNLINAAKALQVTRFVHISSSSIYFSLNDHLDITENQVFPQNILGAYAWSKWECELELINQSKGSPSAIETIVLRPQLVYGRGERVFLPPLITRASSIGLPRSSTRGPITSMTSLDNLVDAIFLSLGKKMNSKLETYNITDGSSLYLLEAIELLCTSLRLPFRSFRVPRSLLRWTALASEKISAFSEKRQRLEKGSLLPKLSSIQCALLTADRTLSIDNAKLNLGFNPHTETLANLRSIASSLSPIMQQTSN
jgi:nucleoside-diphosphate-sugar epimerase